MAPPTSRPENTLRGTPVLQPQGSFIRKALREEKLSQERWDSPDPVGRAEALEPRELQGPGAAP